MLISAPIITIPTSNPTLSTFQLTNMSATIPVAKIELKNKFTGDSGCLAKIIRHCEWKFEVESNFFKKDHIKYIYLFSLCKGGMAGPLAVSYSDQLTANNTATSALAWTSYKWMDISEAFIKVFLLTDKLL